MAEIITRLDQVSEFPLCWPPGKPRAAARRPTPFKTSMARVHEEIRGEMRLWRARDHVISMAPTYRQGPVDPGVALWWTMPGKVVGDLRALACDTYQLREANLHAIALTLVGLRAFERYGTYTREQAIEGARLALPKPPGADEEAWWTVLGVERFWPLEAIEAVWKTKLEKAHPDRGGTPGEAAALNAAIAAARKELCCA
jgi:hypothetical protein